MHSFKEAILMASDVLTAVELVAVLAVYCILFCPILCWAISGSLPSKQALRSRNSHAQA